MEINFTDQEICYMSTVSVAIGIACVWIGVLGGFGISPGWF
jgi:hypothetical protein